MLMCSESRPAACHRQSLIALPLVARGIAVRHVCIDEGESFVFDAAKLDALEGECPSTTLREYGARK